MGLRFNPPPNWPPPPPGFVPPPRWQPDPSWPPPPPGWQVWVDDGPPAGEPDDFADEDYPGAPADYAAGAANYPHELAEYTNGAGDRANGVHAGPSPPSGQPNGFAIAAFVLGAIGGTIVSLVLAIIALRQIRDTGQRGRGLAIAAVVFSVFWAAVLAGYLLLYHPGSPAQQTASGGTSPAPAGTSPSASSSATSAGSGGGRDHSGKQAANVFALHVGDCFQNPPAGQSVLGITYVTVIPCTTPHNAQVFVEFAAAGSGYPGTADLKRQADRGCHARLTGRLVNSKITSTMTLRFLYPLASSWGSDHRTISCLIVDATPDMTGSLLRAQPAH